VVVAAILTRDSKPKINGIGDPKPSLFKKREPIYQAGELITMKTNRKHLSEGFCALIIVSCLSGVAISGERITVTGTVNEDYQLVANDGRVYIVAEPEKVEGLDEIINKKVRVTGTVEESEGVKIITITSYEAVREKTVTIAGTVSG